MMSPVSFLQDDRIFTGVFNGDKDSLFDSAVWKESRRRQSIFMPGDSADSVYWIKSGLVKVFKLTEDGRELIHALYQAGDVFGEMALFENQPREAFAESIEDTQYVMINRRDLMSLAKRKPVIIYRLARLVGERRREAEHEKELMVLKGVKERLACLLLKLGDTYGVVDSRGKMLKVKITHKDLASLVGSSRETVSLALSELRKSGILDRNSDRKIIIKDRERLVSMS